MIQFHANLDGISRAFQSFTVIFNNKVHEILVTLSNNFASYKLQRKTLYRKISLYKMVPC